MEKLNQPTNQPNQIMKTTLLPLLFISFALLTQAQDKPKYDEALAKKLGADNYGMKTYVLVMQGVCICRRCDCC